MAVHNVFPGIDLIYNSVHTDCCCLGTEAEGEFIEIHHCREGRMEQRQGDGFFYLMQGDLSIAKRKQKCVRYNFPLRHYHGISIIIDTDTAPECFSCFLKDVNVRPKEVAANIDRQVTVSELSEKFHASQTCLQNAFKGVYGVPVRSYNRILKMQSAALKLIHTDFTVLAIANECGYDNASKFVSAFRKVMGESPAEYRKVHGVDGNALPGCVGLEQSCVPLEWKEAEGQGIINKDL